jgi:tetratricopeptide (TPR) repeat protein
VKLFKSLFGASAEKHEEKADELRLDFEYRDAAYYYQQALDLTPASDTSRTERLTRKIREVRRAAFAQLLQEAADLVEKRSPDRALETLEAAGQFADEEPAKAEVARRQLEVAEIFGTETEPEPDEGVTVDEGDLFELALAGFDPADRERALALGERFQTAFGFCQKETWPEALEAFDRLLEQHPQDPLVLEMAGLAAESSGNMEAAEERWERARGIDPLRPIVVHGLAGIYRRQGRPADARNLLADAVTARPATGSLSEAWIPIHLEYALLLSENGHHPEAISAGAALLDAPSVDKGLVFYNLAGILERAGQIENCRIALQRAIESAPRRALYRERLADHLVEHQVDLDMALSLLVSANEAETTAAPGTFGGSGGVRGLLSPHRARYLYKMARIYFLKGEDLEAERIITTGLAISRDPEVTGALEDLKKELKEAGARTPEAL